MPSPQGVSSFLILGRCFSIMYSCRRNWAVEPNSLAMVTCSGCAYCQSVSQSVSQYTSIQGSYIMNEDMLQ
jgi:hypothetical protein